MNQHDAPADATGGTSAQPNPAAVFDAETLIEDAERMYDALVASRGNDKPGPQTPHARRS